MPTLFTKPDCQKCEYIKKRFDLKALKINVEVITKHDVDVLAHLAWHEAVQLAETNLPILALDDMSIVVGAIKIKQYLEIITYAFEISPEVTK